MKPTLIFSFILLVLGCEHPNEKSSVNVNNWNKRLLNKALPDSLETGTTYLSVYSQVYSRTQHGTHDLTVTVSMRNVSSTDSIFIAKAAYFDTHGTLIRNYFKSSIFIAPMETVEIVIDEVDKEGGTGGNFLFDWAKNNQTPEPIFESVMISTSGQQGLSFSNTGKRIQ